MKILLSLATVALMANASANDSKAKAEWIPENNEVTPGQPIRTIIRMTVNEGWHTYWVNPGEGGMELSLKADLPEDWTIGELQYPVPKRFMTGELPGFGYEGEIHFPVTITPPADASGTLPELKATLDWLTCNDSSCVPGDATLKLPAQSDPKAVSKAYEKLPQHLDDAKLEGDFTNEEVFLSITLPENAKMDPSQCEVFPITANVLDPAAKPLFVKEKDSSKWITTAAKSEYLSGEPEKLEILLVSPDGESWVISKD